jgi:hypothetical protein
MARSGWILRRILAVVSFVSFAAAFSPSPGYAAVKCYVAMAVSPGGAGTTNPSGQQEVTGASLSISATTGTGYVFVNRTATNGGCGRGWPRRKQHNGLSRGGGDLNGDGKSELKIKSAIYCGTATLNARHKLTLRDFKRSTVSGGWLDKIFSSWHFF